MENTRFARITRDNSPENDGVTTLKQDGRRRGRRRNRRRWNSEEEAIINAWLLYETKNHRISPCLYLKQQLLQQCWNWMRIHEKTSRGHQARTQICNCTRLKAKNLPWCHDIRSTRYKCKAVSKNCMSWMLSNVSRSAHILISRIKNTHSLFIWLLFLRNNKSIKQIVSKSLNWFNNRNAINYLLIFLKILLNTERCIFKFIQTITTTISIFFRGCINSSILQ